MNERGHSGIIVLDKPAGLSSSRVLERLKRVLGVAGGRAARRQEGGAAKLGHLGTLDPLATGVLPVFVGKATRLIPAFEGLDKTYRVELRLGQRTETFDAEGAVTAEIDPAGVTEGAVREALAGFGTGYEQRVPRFSAVKVAGVPAYRLARAGREVPERVRPVRLLALELEGYAPPLATLRVTASAGTYVRSLVDDLGQRLGVGAHVTALRRLACGSLFTLENSITLLQIEEAVARGDEGFVQNPSAYLFQYLPLRVEDAAERQLRDGRTIPLPQDTDPPQPMAKVMALRPCGTLVAIGQVVPTGPGAWGFQPSKVLV